jgi:hypothetical protein
VARAPHDGPRNGSNQAKCLCHAAVRAAEPRGLSVSLIVPPCASRIDLPIQSGAQEEAAAVVSRTLTYVAAPRPALQ